MPNPAPSEHYPIPDISLREKLMEQSQWSVDVNNYRELGEVIATFNLNIGSDPFVGTAEMVVEDGMRRLEIVLYHDESLDVSVSGL